MSKTSIDKFDAARRQIDAAVRMTFAGEDPVAVYSVAAAANRIVRDLCERRGNVESYLRFTDWIVPEHERKFWRVFNSPANFPKHADDDTERNCEIDEETSDFLILTGSKWYRDLGNSYSHEMTVFGWWWALQHPDALRPEVLAAFEDVAELRLAQQQMQQSSRAGRLMIGKVVLDRYKAEKRAARFPEQPMRRD